MARKTEKGGKFRNVHCRSWNMARKLKFTDNKKYTFKDVKQARYYEKHEKCSLYDLEYGKITENVDHEKYKLQDVKYGEEN